MSGNMDSELLLKFIGYFPDNLSAMSRTLLRFFGQTLSKQLYVYDLSVNVMIDNCWDTTAKAYALIGSLY